MKKIIAKVICLQQLVLFEMCSSGVTEEDGCCQSCFC